MFLEEMYDKGERYFEDKSVPDASIEDIDMEMVQSYIEKIGYSKTPLKYLKEPVTVDIR